MQEIEAALTTDNDGGYYAIKGFLYQFDYTIIQILNNPTEDIEFEQVQDIGYEDYVIQVKHKEAQEYTASKIRKPLVQLLQLFDKDANKKYSLYCHFKNRMPEEVLLNVEELNNILGNKKTDFSDELKRSFVENFKLTYSVDYRSQFQELLGILKKEYSTNSEELTIYYHALIRSKLLELAINDRSERKINKAQLNLYIKSLNKVIFHSSYLDNLSKDKYEKMIKKQFFTFNGLNINNFERVFIIDIKEDTHSNDIIQIINRLVRKYYRYKKSPAPIIFLRNLSRERLNSIKRILIDQDFFFIDGTYFDGDYFRIDKIINRTWDISLKIVDLVYLEEVLMSLQPQEVYHFYLEESVTLSDLNSSKKVHIQIQEVEDINRMIN